MEHSKKIMKLSFKEKLLKKRREKIENLRTKVLSYSPSNDIKYRGPLGIVGIRVLAWIFFILGALALILNLGYKSGMGEGFNSAATICALLSGLSVPAFLLGKFGVILQSKDKKGYRGMIIGYGLSALAIAACFYIVYFRYAVVVYQYLNKKNEPTYMQAIWGLNGVLSNLFGKKISFNIFIDMTLYGIYMAAVMYDNPKWNKIQRFFFRCIAIIPIAYCLGGFILKTMHVIGSVTLPALVMPLMPTNTLVTFLAFIIIIGYMKHRQKIYNKLGGNDLQYEEYQKTNACSMYFARSAASAFAITSFIDIILLIVVTILFQGNIDTVTAFSSSTGVGECCVYLLFIPFILIYSYNRPYNSKSMVNLLVPAIGIILSGIVIFEGLFEGLCWMLGM